MSKTAPKFDIPDPATLTVDERLRGRVPLLSIVIPAHNEERWIANTLSRVLAVTYPCHIEIVVVDDGSRDRTCDEVKPFLADRRIRLIKLAKNQGKGAALRAGFAAATGDIIVVQDADDEYDPRDLPSVVQPILDGRARAVYGSRVINQHCRGDSRLLNPFWWGGRTLTWIANVLFPGLHISDEAVCYKAVRADVLRTMPLRCMGFEFCPELTAKLRRRGVRVYNVPIRYAPRSVAAGKKIRPWHWFEAVGVLLRYRIVCDQGPVADFNPAPPFAASEVRLDGAAPVVAATVEHVA